jgi:hypothetical protein
MSAGVATPHLGFHGAVALQGTLTPYIRVLSRMKNILTAGEDTSNEMADKLKR